MLTLALFALPFISSHNFAHNHPEESHQHNHDIAAILAATMPNIVVVSSFQVLAAALIIFVSRIFKYAPNYSARSRAPPLSPLA